MKKFLAPILACLALGFVVAGCGDDEDGAGDNVAAPKDAVTEKQSSGGGASSDKAKAEKSVEVEVVDVDYEPREVTVAKGGKISWTNTGSLPHTVTKDGGPGPDFSSDTMNNGDTYEQTFNTPGTIEYVCKIHPQQRGSITVQ